jgi:tetratricopeptide (TPR) repeat protein
MGALLDHMGDASGAVASYQRALEINEKLHPARHNLAMLYQKQVDWSKTVSADAVRLLEEVRADKPDFHPSRLELARLYEIQGRNAEARENFEAVIYQVKGNIEAIIGLARVLAAGRQFPSAAGVLMDAIKTRAENDKPGQFASPVLYETLADVYTASGNSDGACEAIRAAVRALKRSTYRGDRKALEKRARGCPDPD